MAMEETCVISEVEFDEASIRPVILNFENGTLKPGQEENLLCKMYENNNNKFTVAAVTENIVYSGTVTRDEFYNSFIGVRHKKTNKMRLIAIDYVTLSPLVQGQKQLQNVSFGDVGSTTSELNKQFGSKRAKRQTEQRERMKLDIENVREQLEQTVADVKVDVRDMVAPAIDENDSGYRPRINRDAVNIQNIYCLDEMLSPSVVNSMSEEVSRVLEAEDDEMGTTTFVTQEIKKLRKSSSEKETTCEILLYIDCLIKFMISKAKLISIKKYTSCSYSDVVNTDILQKFTITSPTGRMRPNVMRDKCLCYILVLSMFACGYILNLETLAKELKIGVKKLQDISRILAFSVAKEIATLKLPLPAAVTNVRSGRKKK